MGLYFVYAADTCQRSLSWVSWDSRQYFTVSGLRLPFSSPPTNRKFTVEVFGPASTWVVSSTDRCSKSKSKPKSYYDWRSVSKSWNTFLGLMTRYLLLLDRYGLVSVGSPLWREDGSVFCISWWPLPVQCFSGPSPLELATIVYCLRFETFFSSPPITGRVTLEVFDPFSTRGRPLFCLYLSL
jgi:hypothetical protein